jgi:hypothetical protein
MERSSQSTSELMTEDELIVYLRIPEVSKSKDYHNVVENLKRMHKLPRIHICGRLHVSWPIHTPSLPQLDAGQSRALKLAQD